MHEILLRSPGLFGLSGALDVSPAGYYARSDREPSAADNRREEPAGEIRTAHAGVKRRYGSPRMHAELQARGLPCPVNTAAKVMEGRGIQAISHSKFRASATDSNHDFPVAADVVGRDFTASKPNEVWPGDMTCVPTGEGWPYLAAVEGLYSRRLFGSSMESRLVVDALAMAVQQRFPDEGLVAHSGRAAGTPASTTNACWPGRGSPPAWAARANATATCRRSRSPPP